MIEPADVGSWLIPTQAVGNEVFRNNYNKTPFLLEHELNLHPLFNLERLMVLSRCEPSSETYWSISPAGSEDPGSSVPTMPGTAAAPSMRTGMLVPFPAKQGSQMFSPPKAKTFNAWSAPRSGEPYGFGSAIPSAGIPT